jgi:hypothetical protein
MDFIGRFAVGLASVPELFRVWPQVHLLALAGGVVDFSALRFKQAQPFARAFGRSMLLLVVCEASLGLTLAFFQAWFYWSPK